MARKKRKNPAQRRGEGIDANGRKMLDGDVILTDHKGVPIEKPLRKDYKDLGAFFDAFAEYKRKVANASQYGTARAFHKALSKPDQRATRMTRKR